MSDPPREEPVFRSLHAPGLEEDDLFIALQGLPVPGPYWGDGWPSQPAHDGSWDEEAERRRRHERLLDKWDGDGLPGGRAAQ